MAWNWNESGRIDSFQFEKISANNLNTSLGSLDCQVTGGSLDFSYYSDLKVSGSLEVVRAPASMAQEDYLIRVWYCPELAGETKRIELGTFYFTADLHYENGMYSGTLTLRSLLARHIDDVTTCKWTLGKGKKVSDLYKAIFKSLGGFPKIEGIKDVKLTSTHVFDIGVTPMEILQYLADACGGEINVNSHGQTVLRPYQTPAKKKQNITHTISTNASSVVLAGIDIANNWEEIPNRVVCVYEEGTGAKAKQYTGIAALGASHGRSYQKIGKWITNYYKVTQCGKPYADKLKKLASSYLSRATNQTVYYDFETYYQPISAGEVIKFQYDSISVNGIISQIQMDLAVGAKMQVKIRKV